MRLKARKRLDSTRTFQSLALALMLVSNLGTISREAAMWVTLWVWSTTR